MISQPSSLHFLSSCSSYLSHPPRKIRYTIWFPDQQQPSLHNFNLNKSESNIVSAENKYFRSQIDSQNDNEKEGQCRKKLFHYNNKNDDCDNINNININYFNSIDNFNIKDSIDVINTLSADCCIVALYKENVFGFKDDYDNFIKEGKNTGKEIKNSKNGYNKNNKICHTVCYNKEDSPSFSFMPFIKINNNNYNNSHANNIGIRSLLPFLSNTSNWSDSVYGTVPYNTNNGYHDCFNNVKIITDAMYLAIYLGLPAIILPRILSFCCCCDRCIGNMGSIDKSPNKNCRSCNSYYEKTGNQCRILVDNHDDKNYNNQCIIPLRKLAEIVLKFCTDSSSTLLYIDCCSYDRDDNSMRVDNNNNIFENNFDENWVAFHKLLALLNVDSDNSEDIRNNNNSNWSDWPSVRKKRACHKMIKPIIRVLSNNNNNNKENINNNNTLNSNNNMDIIDKYINTVDFCANKVSNNDINDEKKDEIFIKNFVDLIYNCYLQCYYCGSRSINWDLDSINKGLNLKMSSNTANINNRFDNSVLSSFKNVQPSPYSFFSSLSSSLLSCWLGETVVAVVISPQLLLFEDKLNLSYNQRNDKFASKNDQNLSLPKAKENKVINYMGKGFSQVNGQNNVYFYNIIDHFTHITAKLTIAHLLLCQNADVVIDFRRGNCSHDNDGNMIWDRLFKYFCYLCSPGNNIESGNNLNISIHDGVSCSSGGNVEDDSLNNGKFGIDNDIIVINDNNSSREVQRQSNVQGEHHSFVQEVLLNTKTKINLTDLSQSFDNGDVIDGDKCENNSDDGRKRDNASKRKNLSNLTYNNLSRSSCSVDRNTLPKPCLSPLSASALTIPPNLSQLLIKMLCDSEEAQSLLLYPFIYFCCTACCHSAAALVFEELEIFNRIIVDHLVNSGVKIYLRFRKKMASILENDGKKNMKKNNDNGNKKDDLSNIGVEKGYLKEKKKQEEETIATAIITDKTAHLGESTTILSSSSPCLPSSPAYNCPSHVLLEVKDRIRMVRDKMAPPFRGPLLLASACTYNPNNNNGVNGSDYKGEKNNRNVDDININILKKRKEEEKGGDRGVGFGGKSYIDFSNYNYYYSLYTSDKYLEDIFDTALGLSTSGTKSVESVKVTEEMGDNSKPPFDAKEDGKINLEMKWTCSSIDTKRVGKIHRFPFNSEVTANAVFLPLRHTLSPPLCHSSPYYIPTSTPYELLYKGYEPSCTMTNNAGENEDINNDKKEDNDGKSDNNINNINTNSGYHAGIASLATSPFYSHGASLPSQTSPSSADPKVCLQPCSDTLQLQLQPLTQTLPSGTYEVFECDTAKYEAYANSITAFVLERKIMKIKNCGTRVLNDDDNDVLNSNKEGRDIDKSVIELIIEDLTLILAEKENKLILAKKSKSKGSEIKKEHEVGLIKCDRFNFNDINTLLKTSSACFSDKNNDKYNNVPPPPSSSIYGIDFNKKDNECDNFIDDDNIEYNSAISNASPRFSAVSAASLLNIHFVLLGGGRGGIVDSIINGTNRAFFDIFNRKVEEAFFLVRFSTPVVVGLNQPLVKMKNSEKAPSTPTFSGVVVNDRNPSASITGDEITHDKHKSLDDLNFKDDSYNNKTGRDINDNTVIFLSTDTADDLVCLDENFIFDYSVPNDDMSAMMENSTNEGGFNKTESFCLNDGDKGLKDNDGNKSQEDGISNRVKKVKNILKSDGKNDVMSDGKAYTLYPFLEDIMSIVRDKFNNNALLLTILTSNRLLSLACSIVKLIDAGKPQQKVRERRCGNEPADDKRSDNNGTYGISNGTQERLSENVRISRQEQKQNHKHYLKTVLALLLRLLYFYFNKKLSSATTAAYTAASSSSHSPSSSPYEIKRAKTGEMRHAGAGKTPISSSINNKRPWISLLSKSLLPRKIQLFITIIERNTYAATYLQSRLLGNGYPHHTLHDRNLYHPGRYHHFHNRVVDRDGGSCDGIDVNIRIVIGDGRGAIASAIGRESGKASRATFENDNHHQNFGSDVSKMSLLKSGSEVNDDRDDNPSSSSYYHHSSGEGQKGGDFGVVPTSATPVVDAVISELLGSCGDNELSPECIEGFIRSYCKGFRIGRNPDRFNHGKRAPDGSERVSKVPKEASSTPINAKKAKASSSSSYCSTTSTPSSLFSIPARYTSYVAPVSALASLEELRTSVLQGGMLLPPSSAPHPTSVNSPFTSLLSPSTAATTTTTTTTTPSSLNESDASSGSGDDEREGAEVIEPENVSDREGVSPKSVRCVDDSNVNSNNCDNTAPSSPAYIFLDSSYFSQKNKRNKVKNSPPRCISRDDKLNDDYENVISGNSKEKDKEEEDVYDSSFDDDESLSLEEENLVIMAAFHRPYVLLPQQHQLLSAPKPLLTFDHNGKKSNGRNKNNGNFFNRKSVVKFTATADGKLHGFMLYFNAELYNSNDYYCNFDEKGGKNRANESNVGYYKDPAYSHFDVKNKKLHFEGSKDDINNKSITNDTEGNIITLSTVPCIHTPGMCSWFALFLPVLPRNNSSKDDINNNNCSLTVNKGETVTFTFVRNNNEGSDFNSHKNVNDIANSVKTSTKQPPRVWYEWYATIESTPPESISNKARIKDITNKDHASVRSTLYMNKIKKASKKTNENNENSNETKKEEYFVCSWMDL